MTTSPLLARLLRDPKAATGAEGVDAWLTECLALPAEETPIDDAVAWGFRADRMAFAFAAGYHAALRHLVPSLPRDHRAALSATEQGGAHPRAIATRLSDGRLSGDKRWTTLGDVARTFLVVASTGLDAAGKNRLVIVRVDRDRTGLSVMPMAETPFAPEVRHVELALRDVLVSREDVLPGDGYEDFLKPFRTIEDLFVHGALLGYVLGIARRHGFEHAFAEEVIAAIVTTRALAAVDPRALETHLALAGVLRGVERLVTAEDDRLAAVDPRWSRDRALLTVASRARELRREAAWRRSTLG
jgi:acyl-CoA dehydrogenase